MSWTTGIVVTETIRHRFDQHFRAMTYKLTQRNNTHRMQTSRDTWQSTKLATNVTNGGNGEGHAKRLGNGVATLRKHLQDEAGAATVNELNYYKYLSEEMQINPSSETFKKDSLTVFLATTETPTPEAYGYFAFLHADVTERASLMIESMKENPKWKICQATIDLPIGPLAFELFRSGITDHTGSRLMVDVLLNNSKRSGPGAVPYAGSSGISYGASPTPVWFGLYPMNEFLK